VLAMSSSGGSATIRAGVGLRFYVSGIRTLTLEHGRPWKDRGVAKQETIGARIKRLRLERRMSQRDLSSPGVSYAYISRIEANARTPSVKALRRMAAKLGVTVEHLERGEPTPTELGVADAGLDFTTLTKAELGAIRSAAADSAREAAREAAERVIEGRREAERLKLRKRLKELDG
jgi:transcriptional regulator with XRE-family HTH domain